MTYTVCAKTRRYRECGETPTISLRASLTSIKQVYLLRDGNSVHRFSPKVGTQCCRCSREQDQWTSQRGNTLNYAGWGTRVSMGEAVWTKSVDTAALSTLTL